MVGQRLGRDGLGLTLLLPLKPDVVLLGAFVSQDEFDLDVFLRQPILLGCVRNDLLEAHPLLGLGLYEIDLTGIEGEGPSRWFLENALPSYWQPSPSFTISLFPTSTQPILFHLP